MGVLSDILTLRRVKVPLAASDKHGAIRELIDLLAAEDEASDAEAALQAVLTREQFRSTGIGGGLALPHGKTAAVKRCVVALGKPATAMDFASADGQAVRLVALVLSPLDDTQTAIGVLAELTSLVADPTVAAKLYAADTAQALYEAITEQAPPGRRSTSV